MSDLMHEEEEIIAEVRANMYKEFLFERIVDMRDQGKSYREIAKELGLSVREVWDKLHIKGA